MRTRNEEQSLDNAELDDEDEELEENNDSSSGVYFSADGSVNEADDVPSDNESAPPLPCTQNLVAALESIAGNQEHQTGKEDSQLTTLSI
jgi:hypothetical protein